MKTFVWVVSLFSALLVTTDTYAQDEPSAVRGSHYYRSYCAACHGVDGKGKGPLAQKLSLVPADLSNEQYQTKPLEDLAAVIGGYARKEGSRMPSWGKVLSNPQLRDVATYIPKLTQRDLRFAGDSRRGRAIFKSACVACHGQFGTGRGVLTQLIDVPTVDYTKSENLQRISDEELLNVIREGKGEYMPSWRDVLDNSEIVDVAAYVRRLSRMNVHLSKQVEPNPLAGRNLYRAYCVVCHGVDGKGKGPLAQKLSLVPADLSNEQYQTKDIEDLTVIIAGYDKLAKSNMPNWSQVLPEQDLYDIAAYIPNLGRGDLRFKGDTRRGRALFKHACAACHGQFGAGTGTLAELINIPMVDFTSAAKMAGITDTELISSIRAGKGAFMPSWKHALGDNDIINVAAYVRTLAR